MVLFVSLYSFALSFLLWSLTECDSLGDKHTVDVVASEPFVWVSRLIVNRQKDRERDTIFTVTPF